MDEDEVYIKKSGVVSFVQLYLHSLSIFRLIHGLQQDIVLMFFQTCILEYGNELVRVFLPLSKRQARHIKLPPNDKFSTLNETQGSNPLRKDARRSKKV